VDYGYYDSRRLKNLIIDHVFTQDSAEFIISPHLFRELSLSFKASLIICGSTIRPISRCSKTFSMKVFIPVTDLLLDEYGTEQLVPFNPDFLVKIDSDEKKPRNWIAGDDYLSACQRLRAIEVLSA